MKTIIKQTHPLPTHRPPTHPGKILLRLYLEPSGLSQTEAARQLDMPLNAVNEIVKGKRGISAAVAWKLSARFDTTPQLWMNLQTSYELWEAKHTVTA